MKLSRKNKVGARAGFVDVGVALSLLLPLLLLQPLLLLLSITIVVQPLS
jgi:hypothetical protein